MKSKPDGGPLAAAPGTTLSHFVAASSPPGFKENRSEDDTAAMAGAVQRLSSWPSWFMVTMARCVPLRGKVNKRRVG